jgi:hypothetical protein
MIKIPGPRNSSLGKLDYLLGKTGSQGSVGKGKFFKGVLGFSEENLGNALKNHLTKNLKNAIKDGVTPQGNVKFSVTGTITGPNGKTATIKSVWQVTKDKTIEFITAHPD